MIYMDPQELGWKPLKESYMNTLPSNLQEEHRELVPDFIFHLSLTQMINFKMMFTVCQFEGRPAETNCWKHFQDVEPKIS